MSLYGASVEYGLHCLLYLVDPPPGVTPSSRDLAEFQGISPSYVRQAVHATGKGRARRVVGRNIGRLPACAAHR